MKIDIFYMILSTQTNSHRNQVIAVKLFRRTWVLFLYRAIFSRRYPLSRTSDYHSSFFL